MMVMLSYVLSLVVAAGGGPRTAGLGPGPASAAVCRTLQSPVVPGTSYRWLLGTAAHTPSQYNIAYTGCPLKLFRLCYLLFCWLLLMQIAKVGTFF